LGADTVIAASGTLTTNASSLVAGGSIELTYDGSAITTTTKIQNVTGSAGDDIISGGSGADIIVGGDGNDSIVGGVGIDNLSGGAGIDTFAVAGAGAGFVGLTAAETVSGGTGNDILQFAAGTLVVAASDLVNVSSVETIQIQNSTQTASLTITDAWFTANGTTSLGITATTQTSGATTLAASTVSAANSISLNMSKTDNSAGNVINMGSGNDTLTVDLQALNNTTTLAGGAGTDTLVISANTGSANITQDATVTGWETVSFATAGIAGTFATTVNDAGVAAAATQTINGSNITGTLLWNGAAELDGKFSISGGSGADSLTGGSLVDTISGGIGADVLTGGLGADSLTGGVGADTFVYALVTQSNGSNTDTITDFTTGTDKLQVTLDYSTLVTALDINAVRTGAGVAGSSAAQDTLSGQRGQYVYDTTASAVYVNFNADNLLTTADYKINVNAASTATASIVTGDINFVITGGTAADVIVTDGGADTIDGAAGADSITGGAGADSITGGLGADTITGGAGADSIILTEAVSSADVVVFGATAAANGVDTITGFATTADKLNVDAFGTATALTTVTGAQTNTVNNVYFLGGQAAGAADSIANSVTALAAAGTWTDAAVLSYIIIADDNSSAVYSYTGDAAGNDFTAGEFTLMGTVDAVLVAGDIIFA
jgi:Ca2+-binding RTX toxin-like protein